MDLRLDKATRDIDLSNGAAHLVTGIRAIGQHLENELNSYEGEWFLDPSVGLPYFERILVKGANDADVLSIYRRHIDKSPGVLGTNSLSITHDAETRGIYVSGVARTVEGDFDFSTIPLVKPGV